MFIYSGTHLRNAGFFADVEHYISLDFRAGILVARLNKIMPA
jgi:hypothetical protein